ncbi:MAG: hypothetical protein JSS20_12710 [Proteobacteria bacterium]|nr:hypothetical protein [Pseudomonadota bacterium]
MSSSRIFSSRSSAREITKRNIARYTYVWRNAISGEAVTIEITHTRGYLVKGQDHIEIQVKKPRGARLPITETGYRSHFINALELANDGGPVSFVSAWIERESTSREWQKREVSRAQGDLFDWAQQSAKVTRKKPKRVGAVSAAKTKHQHTIPDPDYVADCEITDGQKAKRMKLRDLGKPVSRPKGTG